MAFINQSIDDRVINTSQISTGFVVDQVAPVEIKKPTAQEEGLFTYFPLLPLELRDRIWESYDHEMRVITIITYSERKNSSECTFQYSASPYFSGANAESRRAILRSYKPLTNHKTMFINPFKDIFQIFSMESYREFLKLGRAKHVGNEDNAAFNDLLTLDDVEANLLHVAFNSQYLRYEKWFEWFDLVRFRGLETVTLTHVAHWHCTEEKKRRWEQNFITAWEMRNGDAKLPQFLWHPMGIDNPNGAVRLWLSQSREGLWLWKSGFRGTDAHLKKCTLCRRQDRGEEGNENGDQKDEVGRWDELDSGWEIEDTSEDEEYDTHEGSDDSEDEAGYVDHVPRIDRKRKWQY